MKRDGRLSGVLHVLLHMAETQEPITSEDLAKTMSSHPVVVRRIMAGLRKAGYVHSAKGHGGGWTLTCDLATITLEDIYRVIGEPALFAIGNRSENPQCLVEQAVNTALDKSLGEAEALLVQRFREVTLADLSADFHQRMLKRKPCASGGHHV